MPKNEDKKVVQKLKDEKLRKIRYGLRTLLRLEYQEKYRDFDKKFFALSKDKSLSFDERRKKHRFIIRKQEEIDLMYRRYPLCCGICGDRMENLVYNPVMYQWRCVHCYEAAHERFPEEYP